MNIEYINNHKCCFCGKLLGDVSYWMSVNPHLILNFCSKQCFIDMRDGILKNTDKNTGKKHD